MIDSHCHLDFPDYKGDFEAVLNRTKEKLDLVINVGTDINSSERAVHLARTYDFIYASVGLHPHDVNTATMATLDRLKTLALAEKVVAIGECGLDYSRLTIGEEEKDKTRQKEIFIWQINIARSRQLPLIIHCRDAYDDLFDILQDNNDVPGVIHCYLGDTQLASRLLNLGYSISFTGIITFKNVAPSLIKAVKYVPLQKILVETDAPFLAPVPYRGQRNEPAYVVEVAKKIAEIKGLSYTEIDELTTHNTRALFAIS